MAVRQHRERRLAVRARGMRGLPEQRVRLRGEPHAAHALRRMRAAVGARIGERDAEPRRDGPRV